MQERSEQDKGRAPGKGNSGRGRGRGVVEGVFAAVDRETRGLHVGGESTLSEAREAGPDGVGGMGWKGVRTSHLHRCCVVLVVQEWLPACLRVLGTGIVLSLELLMVSEPIF